MGQLDIRLRGEPEDVARFKQMLLAMQHMFETGEITSALQAHRDLAILDASRAYADRPPSRLIREYIKIKL